jgi:hypothetical protein
MKENNGSDGFETGGYQGVNEGYSGTNTKGYSATQSSQQSELPSPPIGGSGVVQPESQGGEQK